MCGPSPVSTTVLTPISFPRWTVACTWMTENGVIAAGPTAARAPGGSFGAASGVA